MKSRLIAVLVERAETQPRDEACYMGLAGDPALIAGGDEAAEHPARGTEPTKSHD
jgi:hypothetical protein